MAARFLKALALGMENPPRVAATAVAMREELQRNGVTLDPAAPIVWVETGQEARERATRGRLVVCPQPELIDQGAAIAVFVTEARFTVRYSLPNARKAGATIPEMVIKLGKPHTSEPIHRFQEARCTPAPARHASPFRPSCWPPAPWWPRPHRRTPRNSSCSSC